MYHYWYYYVSFSYHHELIFFHMSLNDSKSPQVSRTLLNIQVDLDTVIWKVSVHPLISKSSSPFTKPLGIILSTLIIIGITITFIFHSFFSSLARSKYLSLFLLSLIFTLWSAGMAKSTIQQVLSFFLLFFLLVISGSGVLARIRWSVYI